MCPGFIQKPSAPNTGDWLTLCIRFDNPDKSSMHAVLLEPRFLSPLDGRSLPSHVCSRLPEQLRKRAVNTSSHGRSPRTSECFTPPRLGSAELK